MSNPTYKEVYADKLDTLKEHLKTIDDKAQANIGWRYFNRMLMLRHMYDEIRHDNPLDGIEFCYGNFNSKIIIILPSFTDIGGRIFISALKDALKRINGVDLENFMVISYSKGASSINKVNELVKELTIIQPTKVITLVDMDIQNIECTFVDMKKREWQSVTEESECLAEIVNILTS